jgi:chloramphenicol 3-O-phosphotransferase
LSGIARIVLLNGVGSAGKSSIAKALQSITAKPFLHVAMDTFIEMLPTDYQEHLPGFAYETTIRDGGRWSPLPRENSAIARCAECGTRSSRWRNKATI